MTRAAVGGAPAVSSAEFDVAVLGATGFTGRLACEYLAERAPPGLRWVMAGRSREKLEELRRALPDAAKVIPLEVVDVTDEAQVRALAQRTRAIANFAGTPFYDKALPVVAACAETGCCYVDITGETPLMRVSADRYDAAARATHSLIIHACGYDSVPFDLGALLAAREMKARHGVGCASIRSYVEEAAGGLSGGTLYTGLAILEQGDAVEGARAAREPYGLDPPGGRGGPDVDDSGGLGLLPRYDEGERSWTAPSVMAAINSRVVRRSNALAGYPYGERMSYGEVQEVSAGLPAALGLVGGLALGAALMAVPLTRRALLQWVLPKPGQGPLKEARDTGFFRTRTVALGESPGSSEPGLRVVAHVESGDGGDPGYKCTARMACEAALCCALERERCYASGGVVTPAVGLGQALVDRLNASGMRLYVDPPN